MPTLTLQKIKNIDQKISELKQQQEKLQQHLELKIISLLKTEKAFTADFEILYGAIYELTQKLKNDSSGNNPNHHQSPEIVNWQKLGIALLQKSKGNEKEKQKNTNAKINSAKLISEKTTVAK